jgi:23S rRNA (cytosine1962-C5)-methyltransferase
VESLSVNGQVTISPAGVKRLRQNHLWIYSADVEKEPGAGVHPIVQVIDRARNHLGYAFYSKRSQIRLRFLSRGSEPPTPEWIHERVRASVQRRRALLEAGSSCRLIFGEADLLPSIVADLYGKHIVLQTLSSGADALKPLLVESLRDLLAPEGIYERNDVKARRLEGLEEICGPLWGETPSEVEVIEEGLRFYVDIPGGQKTGFFLDQRDNRIAAGRYASGRGLDCFTNTGAFALHFSRKCQSVLAIDSSAPSLAQGMRNAALNGITNVDFKEANVFDFLRELERAGDTFDIICLDPPAFAKNRGALSAAQAGYKEINLRAMKILKPEGILVTSSCSYQLSERAFFEIICEASRDARRFVQAVERRGQSLDHPILVGMPETHYLKCFILRVM